MRPIFGLLLGFALFAAAVVSPAAASWQIGPMNHQIDQTNFVVNKGCSGTLIDAKMRYILTARHCVNDQYETVDIEKVDDAGKVTKEKVRRLRDGTVSQLSFDAGDAVRSVTYKVKLIAVDDDSARDLALVQVISPLPNAEGALLACKAPERGDPIYVVGNPMGSLYSSLNTGIVSSIDRDYGLLHFGPDDNAKQPLIQITAGIVGGNSGGAVYDENGMMIGVSVLGHPVNEVLGFAVPLDTIKAFLIDHGARDIPAVAHCGAKAAN